LTFRRSRYFFGEAFAGIIRNRLMSVASILTVASCLMIVSVFYSLVTNIDYFLQQLEEDIGIAVFIDNDVSAHGLEELYEAILQIDNVMSVRFVSHEEAFAIVSEQHEDQTILEGLPPDTFNRSFNIEIGDLRYHDDVVVALEELWDLGIYNIRQNQTIANMVIAISDMIRWSSTILIGILAVVSIIIITNTIRITVNARQNDINIMKYIGATDWFIRWPFVIEGILIGVIGALFPVGIMLFGYVRVVNWVQTNTAVIEFVRFRAANEVFIMLFPIIIGLGALIGTIGSGTSIRRHLHV